jgi:hypothetical protein
VTGQAPAAEALERLTRTVQGLGLRSAEQVADRYILLAEQALGAAPAAVAPAAGAEGIAAAPGSDGITEAVARATRTYLDLIAEAEAIAAGVDNAARDERVVLPQTRPGGSARAPVWLHNPTAKPAEAVTVTLTALTCAGGGRIPSSAIRLTDGDGCDLPASAAVAAGAAYSFQVEVRVPAGTPTGVYHGLLLVSAAVWEPLLVTVPVGVPEQ